MKQEKDAEISDKDNNHESSEEEDIDYDNFKGAHFDHPQEKYVDPDTGAHFEFGEACLRLTYMQRNGEGSIYEMKEVPYSSGSSDCDYLGAPQGFTHDEEIK